MRDRDTLITNPFSCAALRRLLEARRGYQAMLSARLGGDSDTTDADPAAAGEGLPPSTVAVVAAAALFERLLPAGGASFGGWAAATAVYEQALYAAPLSVGAHFWRTQPCSWL